MDNDDAGLSVRSLAAVDEFFEHGVRASLADHELRLKGHVCVLAAPLDGGRPKGEVGNEVSVHDVELDAVASGVFQPLAVLSKLSKVGGQDGRDDLKTNETTTKKETKSFVEKQDRDYKMSGPISSSSIVRDTD